MFVGFRNITRDNGGIMAATQSTPSANRSLALMSRNITRSGPSKQIAERRRFLSELRYKIALANKVFGNADQILKIEINVDNLPKLQAGLELIARRLDKIDLPGFRSKNSIAARGLPYDLLQNLQKATQRLVSGNKEASLETRLLQLKQTLEGQDPKIDSLIEGLLGRTKEAHSFMKSLVESAKSATSEYQTHRQELEALRQQTSELLGQISGEEADDINDRLHQPGLTLSDEPELVDDSVKRPGRSHLRDRYLRAKQLKKRRHQRDLAMYEELKKSSHSDGVHSVQQVGRKLTHGLNLIPFVRAGDDRSVKRLLKIKLEHLKTKNNPEVVDGLIRELREALIVSKKLASRSADGLWVTKSRRFSEIYVCMQACADALLDNLQKSYATSFKDQLVHKVSLGKSDIEGLRSILELADEIVRKFNLRGKSEEADSKLAIAASSLQYGTSKEVSGKTAVGVFVNSIKFFVKRVLELPERLFPRALKIFEEVEQSFLDRVLQSDDLEAKSSLVSNLDRRLHEQRSRLQLLAA